VAASGERSKRRKVQALQGVRISTTLLLAHKRLVRIPASIFCVVMVTFDVEVDDFTAYWERVHRTSIPAGIVVAYLAHL